MGNGIFDPDKAVDLLARFRQDPAFFVEIVLGAKPTKQQRKLLDAMAKPGAKVSVRSGHGTGKSTVLSWLVLWFVSLFEDCKVPCTAPTSTGLKDVLYAEIAKWHAKMHSSFRSQLVITSDRVEWKSSPATRFAVARTSRRENPDALQGFHATNLLFIIDEASGVDEKVFEVAEGALSTKSARVVLTGNPTKLTGYFYNSHNKFRDHWTRLHFSCEDPSSWIENGGPVDPAYPEEMRKKYGYDNDIYRVRVKGDFPNASVTQLIPLELIEGAQGLHLRKDQYAFAPVVLGVDVAWEGDDSSCVYLRQGLMSKKLGKWHNIDNMTLAGLVAGFEEEYCADAVFIDVGWGTGVIDRLKQLGRNPIPVNFGGSSSSERYINKRTQMWVEMKEWLEDGGSLPPGEDLRSDLLGPEYGFSASKNKIALESKKDMKKRGLPSPDEADALALTFAEKVVKNVGRSYNSGQYEFGQNTHRHFTKHEYDIFA